MVKKDSLSSISIRNTIIIIFILSTLITVGIISYVVFSNWTQSADKTLKVIAEDLNEITYNYIESYLSTPENMNEVNQKLIRNNIIDINNPETRDKFVIGVLQSHTNGIHSFAYGTEEGEYYGARINEEGELQLVRSNASTGGNAWYYSVNDDLTANVPVIKAGKYDPRTREWYIAAKNSGEAVFSPIYKHFIMDDLAITSAWPIYDELGELQGVMGTHVLLSNIDSVLNQTVQKYNGYALIIEEDTKYLVANSFNMKNYVENEDGTVQRISLDHAENKNIVKAFEQYKYSNNKFEFYENGNDSLYLNIRDYHKNGLDWVVITAIPKSMLAEGISDNFKLTLILVIIAMLVSMAIYFYTTRRLFKPIDVLEDVTIRLASGDLSGRVDVVRDDEIGRIAKSFNNMADTIHNLVHNLEQTVKERTSELEKLSSHDSLTGLYNRTFFLEYLKNINKDEVVPISIIFGDINGLKLTNDIFGHAAGDELIKRSAEILKRVCRSYDVVARLGGDEFIILLPNTGVKDSKKIMKRIKKEMAAEKLTAIKCSISLGVATMTDSDQDIEKTINEAEDAMYKEKTMSRKETNKELLETLIAKLYDNCPCEKQHSISVQKYCEDIAKSLNLSYAEVEKIKKAGLYHDIGKIVIERTLLNKKDLTAKENLEMQQHAIVGYRILNLFNETLDIADGIYSHHENWDGTGYPRGLKGEEIPLMARIITVAEMYDELTNPCYEMNLEHEKIIEIMKNEAGKSLDPNIVKIWLLKD
jgi:diguanylate cyclase (GGDEF)-like protein/putative nucleotidyltransferase with HDIG domain